MYNSLEKINKGIEYANVASAVTKNELTIVDKVNTELLNQSVAKFIPASGAATRMFKDLYAYVENKIDTDFLDYFFEQLENFAFYKELNTYIDIKLLDLNNTGDRVSIIEILLNNEMKYGNLPKALIKFHQYEVGNLTPIDEHIYEGEKYLNAEEVNLHFTIAEKDEELFNDYVKKALEGKNNINIPE